MGNEGQSTVTRIRLSLGSAVSLGLRMAKMEAAPTTLYTLLGETCLGACRFCTQARRSDADRQLLSRVIWPEFELPAVLESLQTDDTVRRMCIQTLLYPDLLTDLLATVRQLKTASDAPLSICMNPVGKEWLVALKEAGVERVGVGLDCATEALFNQMKPGFSWNRYLQFVDETVEVFGVGSVHLIAGLGETDEELVRAFQTFHDKGCTIALFAFTPVRGTQLDLAPPPLERYRALQLARYLIAHGQVRVEDMTFDGGKLVALNVAPAVLDRAIEAGTPFRTSGCPNCNRPMYNERPGGDRYNHPAPLTPAEKSAAREALRRYFNQQI
ncbi:MAG TPA: radical SAM protein [Anaerolineae bacterium]|nr:radical SAM protein [Anaerolineae bacterium]HQK13803.1 radical SAM protein [Anaerolineae bacterium]